MLKALLASSMAMLVLPRSTMMATTPRILETRSMDMIISTVKIREAQPQTLEQLEIANWKFSIGNLNKTGSWNLVFLWSLVLGAWSFIKLCFMGLALILLATSPASASTVFG